MALKPMLSLLLISALHLLTPSYATPSRNPQLIRTLTPLRRDAHTSNLKRATDLLLPRSSVVLDYAYDGTAPAHVTVQVQAHQDRPILLLEALDPALIHSVACDSDDESESALSSSSSTTISLTLPSEEVAHTATRTWAPNGNGKTSFNVITSHLGCNAADERGFWSVSAIERHAGTVVLYVSPLPLQDVGHTFDVSLRHVGLSNRTPQRREDSEPSALGKRDFEATADATLTADLSGQQIFPGNSSTLGLASDVIQQLTDASLEITCADCASHLNFTMGVDFTFTPGVVGISKASMFAAVLEFAQSAVLDIKVGATLEKDFEFDVPPKIPLDGFMVPGLFSIGPFIGLHVQFNFSITAAVDFTVGANTTIPAKANATIDLLTPSNGAAIGWDGGAFTPVPLRVNSGAPNFTIGAALAPFIEFDLNVGGLAGNSSKVGLTARLMQTTPAIELDFTALGNVNSACAPQGDNDFSFFGTAYSVDATLGLETTGSVDVNDAGILESVGLDVSQSFSRTLFSHTFNLFGGTPDANQTCFIIADDGGSASSSGNSSATTNSTATPSTTEHPAASGTLLAASSAVPTYDIAKIQTYYDAHGNTLPPGITFQQLQDSGQQIPDTIQAPAGSSGSSSGSGSGSAGGSSGAVRSHGMDVYVVAVVCMLVSVAVLM